ncbi:hypothetical protein ABRQ00_12870 [Pectobacterium aroidearum]|uniref:hypothetical protein n=1 Tax=Pectobacterium TaxID=122277 RepID=UPI0002E5A35C|nr:hypothetical protein [Pectobacterium carotovorum]MBG0749615.1 hypothetical protein [Pectobacterium carotovorum subsp. carotovorum PCCS1]
MKKGALPLGLSAFFFAFYLGNNSLSVDALSGLTHESVGADDSAMINLQKMVV